METDKLNSAIAKLQMCFVNENDNCQTLANGTGFFWKNNSTGKKYFITNWHNISGH